MKNPNRKAAMRRADAMAERGESDTIIVYNSSNGATMQYAAWLSDVLDCDVVNYNRKNLAYVSLYKTVIFMGWIRAGEITRLMMLRQNYDNFNLKDKNLYIVGVGIGPAESEMYINRLRQQNSCNNDVLKFFYLAGKYDPSNLKSVDKASLYAMSSTMYEGLTEEDMHIMKERFEKGYDGMDPDNLRPLVESIFLTES